MSAAERAATDAAVRRGQVIYVLDRAAWVSTDEMKRRVPDLASIRGWVVEPRGDRLVATYFSGETGARQAVFSAEVKGGSVVSSHVFAEGDDRTLTPAQGRMAEAFAAAHRFDAKPCTPARFNVVVLPPTGPDGPVTAYLLSPQVKTGEFPVGGHYRVDLAPDGRAASSRAFSKACLTMGPPPEGQPKALFVTHVLDQTPTEIHVFLALSARLPLIVMTMEPPRAWGVDGREIILTDMKLGEGK